MFPLQEEYLLRETSCKEKCNGGVGKTRMIVHAFSGKKTACISWSWVGEGGAEGLQYVGGADYGSQPPSPLLKTYI